MIETVTFIVYSVVMALMLVAGIIMSWIYRRLRSHHYDVWDQLGQPSLFLNASVRIQQRVARFLWKAEYEELRDETLSRVASIGKVIAVITTILVVAMLALIMTVLSES